MKKSVILILTDLVFLIVFNVLFFVLGGVDRLLSVWVAYGFIHFAYVMVLVTPFLTKGGNSRAIFGGSIFLISMLYFFVQLAVGVIVILNPVRIPFVISLPVQVVLAGIYVVSLLMAIFANEHTAEQLATQSAENYFIKDLSSRLNALNGQVSDAKARQALDMLHNKLHASPSASSNAVAAIENQIAANVDALERAAYAKDDAAVAGIAEQTVQMVEERNRRLRMSNV